MQLLTYSLVSIISFSGILAGMLLAFAAKEELGPGKKYFILLQKIILLLILVFLLNFFNVDLYLRIIYYVLFIVLMAFNIKSQLIYPCLAVVFFLSSTDINLFITNSVLIFLYGFPTGSLSAKKLIEKKKSVVLKNIFLSYFWFVAIAIILKIIFI